MSDDYEARIQLRVEQYKWAAEIVKEMIEELGEEKALEISQRALTRIQEETGRGLAAEYGDTFEGFKQWLHEAAEKNPYITVSEEGPDFIQAKVTRCASWEALKRLGLPQLCRCYCAADPEFTRGFNPRLVFSVEHQLSNGDDCCDNTWHWKG